uniref:Uncharacterized protein n=1 Tax=Octopus bimaculoides TaxID=37653 RepID=A0A0L8GQ50_OCTBM
MSGRNSKVPTSIYVIYFHLLANQIKMPTCRVVIRRTSHILRLALLCFYKFVGLCQYKHLYLH